MAISRLLARGVDPAAFPLHELEMTQAQLSPTAGASGGNPAALPPFICLGPFDPPRYQVPDADSTPHQLLCSCWACWRCWHKYQPLLYEGTLGRRWPSTLPGTGGGGAGSWGQVQRWRLANFVVLSGFCTASLLPACCPCGHPGLYFWPYCHGHQHASMSGWS